MNPASAGMKDGFSAMLLHRTQWAGFGPGSPLTTTFSIHSPFKILKGGLGLTVVSDALGFDFKTQGGHLTYSFHKNLGNGKLGIGTNIGFLRRSLDPSKFKPVDQGDPLIPTTSASSFIFDMGLGAWYQTPTYYVGLSIPHVNGGSFELNNGASSVKFDRNVYLQGGYKLPLTEEFKLLPNALVKFNSATTQIDVNANLMYQDFIWLGLSYSSQDYFSTLVGAQIMKNIKFGYAYDFSTTHLGSTHDGSHEIFLSYDFSIVIPKKPKIIIKSPRFL